jgi:polysaccharide export outer membrane protein
VDLDKKTSQMSSNQAQNFKISAIENTMCDVETQKNGTKWFVPACVLLAALAFTTVGCKTGKKDQQAGIAAAAAAVRAQESEAEQSKDPDKFLLREGDAVRITFPAAPNLNTVQAIRRDGKIALPLVGEVHAAGLAPTALEKRLLELYGPQLTTKEVTVSLESSAFPVYVTGAVLRPGKVVTDRPISAIEAVMEAGGFDYTRANLKKVRIIRYVQGEPQYFTLNLKNIMEGKENQPFPLKPSDILYVPERFTWF